MFVKGKKEPYNSPEGEPPGKKHGIKGFCYIKIVAKMIENKPHTSVTDHKKRPHEGSFSQLQRKAFQKKRFHKFEEKENSQGCQRIIDLHGITQKRRRIEGKVHSPRERSFDTVTAPIEETPDTTDHDHRNGRDACGIRSNPPGEPLFTRSYNTEKPRPKKGGDCRKPSFEGRNDF